MPINNQYKIVPYQDEFRQDILKVWEASVSATHHFLQTDDFRDIRQMLLEFDFSAISVFCLISEQQVKGFVGIAGPKIEMLFLSPEIIGKGYGKVLLHFAINQLNANLVDVNEQNIQAAEFYRKSGFRIYKRSDKDEQGRNYPILHMTLL